VSCHFQPPKRASLHIGIHEEHIDPAYEETESKELVRPFQPLVRRAHLLRDSITRLLRQMGGQR